MIARQAIVNAQHMVVGYELFNRSRTGAGHTAATDVILVFTALSHAGTEELVGKKLNFVNCTHESLAGGHLELLDPDKVVLEIPPLGHTAGTEVVARLPILAALRERGMWVTAIRPPTVPPGTARLRLTLTAAHDARDIQTLLEALHVAGE